jgi:mannosyltransferase
MSLDVATRSWERMWAFYVQLPEQHPLYYLILRVWLGMGSSELVLRSLSALFAVASLWALYALARELFDDTVARVAAVLLCFSPFYLYFGQEARMYTLLGFLTLVNAYALVRWLRTGGHAWLAWYAVTAVLGMYTHFFFVFNIGAHLVFVAARDRALSRAVVRLFLVEAMVGVLYLPWALLILAGRPESQEWKGIANIVFGIPYAALRFSVGYAEVLANYRWKEQAGTLLVQNAGFLALAALCFGALAVVGFRALSQRGEEGWFVIACLAVPPLLALLGSAAVILVGDRYLIVSFPFYLLLLAAAMVALARTTGRTRVAAAVVVVLYVAVVGRSLASHYFDPEFGNEQWAEVAEYIRSNTRPEDPVVVHSGYTMGAFQYYYRPEQEQRLVRSDQLRPADIARANGIWLVLAHPADPPGFAESFAREYRVVSERLFPKQSGIRVLFLERTVDLDPGGEGNSLAIPATAGMAGVLTLAPSASEQR